MSGARRGALLLGLVTAVTVALPASAVVPKADRIAKATVKANETAARTQALQLDLTLRVADREPIGTGTLVTHPTGLARLELRDAADRTERHLLLGTDHSASRNGNELEKPRAFLPPLFLLQVDSPATLEQALSDYGLDVRAAALAPCGDRICYVLGDPSRVAPGGDGAEGSPNQKTPDFSFSQTLGEPAPPPSIWVDTRSFEIVRIESADGVVVEFGPPVDFAGIRFPDAITIHEPEREPVRFDILGVTAVNAPAAGFTRTWLLTPTDGPGDGDLPRAPASRTTPMGQSSR